MTVGGEKRESDNESDSESDSESESESNDVNESESEQQARKQEGTGHLKESLPGLKKPGYCCLRPASQPPCLAKRQSGMVALHHGDRRAYAIEALTVSTILSSTNTSQACLQDKCFILQGIQST